MGLVRKVVHSDPLCRVARVTQENDNSVLVLGVDGPLKDEDYVCQACVELIFGIVGLELPGDGADWWKG